MIEAPAMGSFDASLLMSHLDHLILMPGQYGLSSVPYFGFDEYLPGEPASGGWH